MNLYALLRSFDGLTAIVGSNIYPMLLPSQETYPSVTYQVIARVSNASLSTGGLNKLRLHVDSFGKDYATADAAREALIQALDGYVGEAGGVQLQNAQVITTRDTYEDQIELYRLSLEAYLYY